MLGPMLDQTEDFVYLEPVVQSVPIVVQGFLVLANDNLGRGRQVIEFFQYFPELSPVKHILRIELIYQIGTQLININYIGYARQ